jgi:hypothetical protein
MKDTYSQSGFQIGFFKGLGEVFYLSGTRGGNNRNRDILTDVVVQLNIEVAVSALLSNKLKSSTIN